LGDVSFKQPPEFTRRILYNLFPGFHDTSPWEEFLVRNHTPPYISAEPEITHRRLEPFAPYLMRAQGQGHSLPQRYLVLFSDGFADLCTSSGLHWVLTSWAQDVNAALASDGNVNGFPPGEMDMALRRKANNMALRLLRRALGGEDCFSVSRVLTLDMDVAWIDDTAIVVQTL
jgi:pyruvate dehydrogenase phosphatase